MDYDKVLVLKFENAGIFKKAWNKKDISRIKEDRILDNSFQKNKLVQSRNPRTKGQWDEVTCGTLYVSHVANMLAVLAGLRPSSKFRNTCVESDRESNSEIIELAKRARVKINSFITCDKDNNEKYCFEQMMIRKSLHDSWGTATPSWLRMKYLLPKSLYDNLVKTALSIVGGNALNMLFDEVSDILAASKSKEVKELIKQARENRREPLAKLLEGNKTHSLQQHGYNGLGVYLKALVVKGVAKIARIDGTICVPLTNDELKLFSRGVGFATLLEGGVVTIEAIDDLGHTSLDTLTNGYKGLKLDKSSKQYRTIKRLKSKVNKR